MNANVIYAVERARFFLYAGLASAVLMIVAAITIIPSFGLIGAASSRAAIQIAVSLLSFWYISRRLGCPIPYGSLLRLTLAATLCALAARAAIVLMEGRLELPVAVLVGGLVYVASVRLLGGLPRADAERLRRAALSIAPRPLVPMAGSVCHIVLGHAR